MSLVSMSPEQALGQTLSPACDVFSLGILLYELAAGRHPFHGVTQWELAAKVLTQAPPPLAGLAPPELQGAFCELVMACLEKDPAKRLTAAELRRRLEEPARPPRRRGHHKRILIAAALLTLVLAAALAWTLRPPPPAPTAMGMTEAVEVFREVNDARNFDSFVADFAAKEQQTRTELYRQEYQARVKLEKRLKACDPDFVRIHDTYAAARTLFVSDRSHAANEQAYYHQIDAMSAELRRRAKLHPALLPLLQSWNEIATSREDRVAAAVSAVDPAKGAAYRQALKKIRAER